MTIQKTNLRRYINYFWQYAILIIFVLIVTVPLVTMAFGSLKTRGEYAGFPYQPPDPIRWENYIRILSTDVFWGMLRNSLIVMIGTVVGVVLFSSLAAFVFARNEFRGKNILFNYLTIGLLFPISVAILPEYILLRQLDWLDTHWALIIPQIAFGLSLNIFILRGFFQSIPGELQDAAYIDGCTTFDFFWRILLPLARPAIAAVSVLAMIASWNEVFLPLMVLNSEEKWTLPLGTMQFRGQYGSDIPLVLAFVTLSMVPTLIFYFLAERQIISGLTAGALKG
ncbi:MAG TPA: carbohydrate ABC transporter permease [Anaerolineae bacterium]|nr:carbohydrate ABC transporter permease [Anaerolineae bacterium]